MSEDSLARERLAEYARRAVTLEARVAALEEELAAVRASSCSEQRKGTIMGRRAALIITDAEVINLAGSEYWADATPIYTSEQLLADLRTLVAYAGGEPRPVSVLASAAARVRALLPEEDEDE
jgi:hypothetical protein